MIQLTPFRHQRTVEDVRCLDEQLAWLFRSCPPPARSELVVWNLACGRADESGAIASALRPAGIAHYLGIDLRGHCVREARQRWHLPGAGIEFIEGDAALLPTGNGPGVADLVFIRHQNYWHDPVVWHRIFERALACLAEDGALICSSYFDREHELMKSAMRGLGAQRVADFRNPFSRALPNAPGKSVDRHLAAFRKIHPSTATILI